MERILRAVHEGGFAGALLRDPANVFYASSFRPITDSRPVLLVLADTPVLVVPELEVEHARQSSSVSEVLSYGDQDFGKRPPLEVALATALPPLEKACPRGRIAFESWQLCQGAWQILARSLGAERLGNLGELLHGLRRVKSREEIESIRKGCELSDWAMAWELKHGRPGISEFELKLQGNMAFAQEASRRFAQSSIRPGSRPIFGANTVLPHAASGATVLREGDVVIHGVGFTVDGYHSENERCIFVDTWPSIEARKAYGAMTTAQAKAIEAMKPGRSCAEIHALASREIEDKGYGDFLLHRTGHGLGIDAHESPFLAEGDATLLQPGMVVTCEPGIYIPGLGGFRHSDTIVITDTGHEVLTKHAKWHEGTEG